MTGVQTCALPISDGKGGRYTVEARSRTTVRVAAVRIEHPRVSVRHVPLPAVAVSDDGLTWRPIADVRRLRDWAWAGRTLFRFSTGAQELLLPATRVGWLRVDFHLPYDAGDRPVDGVCFRGEERG